MPRDYCVDIMRREQQAASEKTPYGTGSDASQPSGAPISRKLLSLFRSDGSGAGRAANQKMTAPSLRQTYGVSVVCHVSDSTAIEATLKGMFEHYGLALESLRRDPVSMKFVRLTALVESSIAERGHLVWIVNHLAAMPSVRHVHWETLPHLRGPAAR